MQIDRDIVHGVGHHHLWLVKAVAIAHARDALHHVHRSAVGEDVEQLHRHVGIQCI